MSDVLSSFNTRQTPQTQQADEAQVQNNAGGFVFEITPDQRLRRFLTLGTDGGTYYTSAKDLTVDNAKAILAMITKNEHSHIQAINTIVEISVAGRAPKANPALFALALAASHGSAQGRAYALAALPKVARTGTHLFIFTRYIEQFRGWGRGLKRAVGEWYTEKAPEDLAYQVAKYRQREGWTHADLLRLSKPKGITGPTSEIFDWITKGNVGEHLPAVIEGFLKAQEAGANYVDLINAYPSLSWEMLPDEALGDPKVWEALITNGIPQTALMRNLPRLTNLGVLKGTSEMTSIVAARLQDPERLKKARVHPVNVLIAQRTYASGRSMMGKSEWKPVRAITDALDAGFYAAFGAVEPSGKRTKIGVDVSGSMGAPISGMPLQAREAAGALALVQVATEPLVSTVGFSHELVDLDSIISPRRRLDDVVRSMARIPFGWTDCSLPITQALEDREEIDTFIIYTDNETYYGDIHPHEALRQYSEQMGIQAKLIVAAMTSTGFSIAKPNDPSMLDVVGFDSAVPNLIADFSRGL